MKLLLIKQKILPMFQARKIQAFILLIFVNTPDCEFCTKFYMPEIAVILAWAAIIFCVVRAIPVVAESGKLFDK